jgi:hypothetical protein
VSGPPPSGRVALGLVNACQRETDGGGREPFVASAIQGPIDTVVETDAQHRR